MSEYILQWESPPLEYYWLHHFVFQVYERCLIEKAIGFQENEFLAHSDQENFQFFLPVSELERLRPAALDLYEDESRMLQLFRSITALARSVRAMSWIARGKDAHGILEGCLRLEPLFQQAVALHLCSQPHLTRVLGEALEEDLLCRGHSAASAVELCGRVTMPTRLPRVMEEQLEWYSAIAAIARSPMRTDAILAQHLARWRYVRAGDSQPPMDDASLRERLSSDLQDTANARNQLRRLKAVRSGESAHEINSLCSRHLTERGRRLAGIIREVAYHRFVTKELWMKLWYLLETARRRLGEILGRNVEGFTSEELASGDLTELEENSRSTYLFCRRGGENSLYYNGLDVAARGEYLCPPNYAEMIEVRGDVGHPGVVQGVALCVGWKDEIQARLRDVGSGTILVVPQTTPAFVPLLSRCAGLIIDEGGITGHGSIVSREMHIPSLIGTRIGTKVFRTGQRVELNTNLRSARKIPHPEQP